MIIKENAKRPVNFLSRIINNLFDRIVGVIGAVIFAQIPQFIAQYMQRLGGHVDELKRIITKYTTDAQAHKLTLEAYIQKHLNSSLDIFKTTGQTMQENLIRFNNLHQSLTDLTNAAPYAKFFLFIKNIELSIAKAVYKDFTPGIPATYEGLAYAVIGIFFAIFLYYGIKKALQKILKKIVNKIKQKKTPKGPNPVNFNDQQYTQLDDFDFKGPY